jgi:cation diffusion facilitator CzcD-associated flavoprotein CzcO
MSPDHVDVLIVGAGLSGIGAGYHLQTQCPGKSYAIFEARADLGGTWDLFRYPGIRSDSDMYTLGYRFKPWKDAKAIADGPSILRYVKETARENGIDSKIRFRHRVVRAEWSSDEALWTVTAERTDTGHTVELTAGFLFMCTGYYHYSEPYTPDFKGTERFKGQVVHPQHWSDDIEYEGKRVVVIGSGATAVTLVPAMAEQAAHVTMLQRSPTYIISLPGEDPVASFVRRVLPAKAAYAVVRWKNVLLTTAFFQLSRRRPRFVKGLLMNAVRKALPVGYPVETHFKPKYNPWDQRVCLVPDGDLFEAINNGTASIATDEIDTFTETGIKLASGEELEADVIVTATGLNLLALGGMELAVDGDEVQIPQTVGYKGMMLSGVPNLAISIGYTNASWTLKCDLTCEYACRLLNHMDEHGYRQATPRLAPDTPTQPFIDLKSGYVLRSLDKFPKQGLQAPWRLYQNYARDILTLRYGAIEDGALEFSNPQPAARPAEPTELAA